MEDIQIIVEFKSQVREVYPEAEVYFYGSRAAKTHRRDSDYDVLVVLGKISSSIRDIVYDLAWEVGFKYDAFISPVLVEKEEFVNLSASPFYNNVKRHGVMV